MSTASQEQGKVKRPRLNIGDQSWRQAREALIIRCEKCGGTDFDEKEELGGTILTCKDCGRIIVNQVMLSADHDPCPLNEPIAVNQGLGDGDKGRPNSLLLSSEFRSHYIRGYANGAWWRYSRECRFGKTKDELFELIYMPRYPHDPPVWYA